MDKPLKSLTHGQCNARPTVTFPAAGHHRPSPYQIILLDDRDICVWTTCIEKTLKYSNCLYFRILLLEILLYACLVIGCRVYVVENSCYCSGKQWVVQGSCIQHYQCDTSECLLSSINFFVIHFVNYYCTLPSVLWRCWLGGRKGIRPVKNEWWGVGVVVCLERGADLHMAQQMPLPLTVSCSSKIQIVLPFWYRLTQVVLEKRPLNGCSNYYCTK